MLFRNGEGRPVRFKGLWLLFRAGSAGRSVVAGAGGLSFRWEKKTCAGRLWLPILLTGTMLIWQAGLIPAIVRVLISGFDENRAGELRDRRNCLVE